MFFKENLLYLIKTNNYKKIKLAEKLGITRQAITDLMKTTDPRASTIIKISKLFNVSIDDLLLKDLEKEQLL